MITLINFLKKIGTIFAIIGTSILAVVLFGKKEPINDKTKKDIDAVVHADPKLKPFISEDIASRV